MRFYFGFTFLILLGISCKKESGVAGNKVAIYRYQAYRLMVGRCQVDETVSLLKDSPLVSNEAILKYSSSNYSFQLSTAAYDEIKKLGDGTPMAVTVDGRLIYIFILKPLYSSFTCFESITADYSNVDNELTMRLGNSAPGNGINDQRNNPDLLATLRKQGKLR